MRLIWIALLGFGSCAPNPKPTVMSVNNGAVGISHDANAKTPPVVAAKTDDIVIPLPPSTKIVVREYSPPSVPTERIEEIKSTTIELPKESGSSVTIKRSEVNASGSAGHEPPPPPTPFEKSLSVWSYVGVGLLILGIYFCTPWGGSNYRVGALIAAGGLTMSILGVFLNELSQWAKYKMPPWIPAVGFLGIGAAIFLYWGYRHRHRQIEAEAATK